MPNFDTVLLNKQNWCKPKDDIWVLHHKIPPCKMKANATFYFWYCVDNFYPWKDIVGKKVSKLRSIAELRAFNDTLSTEWERKRIPTFLDFILMGTISSAKTPASAAAAQVCWDLCSEKNKQFWVEEPVEVQVLKQHVKYFSGRSGSGSGSHTLDQAN